MYNSPADPALDLTKVVFGRRGSFLAFYLDDFSDGSYGHTRLYLGSCSYLVGAANRNRLLRIRLLAGGQEVPYAIRATPTLLRAESLAGYVEFCIAEPDLVRLKGEGVALCLSADLPGHESAKGREAGCFEVDFGMVNEKYLFQPVAGRLQAQAPFDYRQFGATSVSVTFLPPEGESAFEGAVLQFCTNALPRQDLAPFGACVNALQADFDAWQAKLPQPPAGYATAFGRAAYLLWSNVVRVGGNLKSEMISVDQLHCAMAYSWQQSYQAVAHARDLPYAWQLLLSAFDYQDEAGQLAEAANDTLSQYQTCKPPIQGLVLRWLMDHCDLGTIPSAQLERLYGPLGRWTEFWFTCRDRAGTGLPAYDHGDESGMDDTSLFRAGVPLHAPDLAAYLVVQMDALARLAALLGRPQESTCWTQRADALTGRLLDAYWDGQRFVALQGDGPQTAVAAESLQSYMPLVLGSRLPADIRAKLVAGLQAPGKFMTPYGLASEAMDSPYFELSYAWTRGSINAPNQFLTVLALDSCGETALATRIATAYCANVEKHGPHQHFNPFTGQPLTPFGFFGLHYQPWTGWAAGVFAALAGHYAAPNPTVPQG